MPRRLPSDRKRRPPAEPPARGESELRIVGGNLRGSKLRYTGREETRPMKDRVREATFNLVGPSIAGKHAVDLFAGTGAIGFEALSRGAVSATFIERHVPTAKIIRENAERLGVAERCTVDTADALLWLRQDRHLPAVPWVVFVSPPWDLLFEEQAAMLRMIGRFIERSPAGSIIVVEGDKRFDTNLLPEPDLWRVRKYPPAVLAIFRKGGDEAAAEEA